MSYIVQEPTNFINIKLTDTGRRLLSLGALTFNKILLSDREVNYSLAINNYDICRNRILSPKDGHPSILKDMTNSEMSGITISSQNLTSARQIVSAMTKTFGFFSGSSNNWNIKSGSGEIGQGDCLGFAEIDYSINIPSGGTQITVLSGAYSANTGDLVYIPWEPIQYSSITNNTAFIYSGRPNVSLWYRVQGVTGQTIELDRDIPNFGNYPIAGSSQKIKSYFYPFNGVESFYGSATTVNTGIWNMNIVRTSSEIGTSLLMDGYTKYGSVEYNGTKHYLGFTNETKVFGIIHYSNKYSGNTLSEQLVPGTVKLEIPNIMWHRNFTTTLGTELNSGVVLYDFFGSDIYDTASGTSYRELRDGTSENSFVVGRVYHKLKIIIITDQELLTVLTYKSNRNYTLPELSLNLTPSSLGISTGICKTDYSYYVTYLTSSLPYQDATSFGYPQSLPCGYVSKIDGYTDAITGLPSILRINFPSFSFPYLRSETNLSALSGTGWNANSVQIMLQEIATSATTKIGDLPTQNWRLISNGVGNGIYTGETGNNTINPSDLQNHIFNITQQDYDSGTTYSLTGKYSAFTSNSDSINLSGLSFGSESFFYGSLSTGIQANIFKTIITIYASNENYNTSNNTSFDSLYNDSTFISEIGILNTNNELVAVAKPAYPIKKNNSRYLAFQLELDF